MFIPKRKLTEFVTGLSEQCFSSRKTRINRGIAFNNYFEVGSSDPTVPSLFNKIYESLDNVESLLYSPVSLRFLIGDHDDPSLLSKAKGKRAAARLRKYAEQSDTDTMISAAVRMSLKKGKGFIKQLWRKEGFRPCLVSPDDFGVWRENVTSLDTEMECFAHRMLISPWEFARLVDGHPKREKFLDEANRHVRSTTGTDMAKAATMQVTVGGLYPFQPAGGTSGQGVSSTRGVVDWLTQPTPQLAPEVEQSLLEMDEVWVWDDNREDWATFQLVAKKMLIMGDLQIINAFAYDTVSKQSAESLKGKHPFNEFCVNPVDDYFWGDSEIRRLIGLQDCINSRIAGTNKMLRKQEDPTRTFTGAMGVNQEAMSRLNKPGGYWVDQNPNAKTNLEQVTIPQDMWASLHEYERMFDDIEGVPHIARGHAVPGVRSAAHADTLIRQYSPRFKDRALLVERQVAALGGLMLDMARAHDDKVMTAWVPGAEAGIEGRDPDAFSPAPAKGFKAVPFRFADLGDDVTLTVDSHSSSPAFAQDAKALNFDLLKVGAMGPEDIVEHVDAPDAEELEYGIARRGIAQAEAKIQEEEFKLAGKKH